MWERHLAAIFEYFESVWYTDIGRLVAAGRLDAFLRQLLKKSRVNTRIFKLKYI